ncbi:hypothetical protein ElyMa_004461200 [Elysia marginata]|uniref:Uncharacterized protein n=1 Tax=Elysia marginata TaxID=1093978 RepID=A0AAV4HHD5_9GAST|nr:hypothetical protein ElyMa_004461200 [Elysia marginata]
MRTLTIDRFLSRRNSSKSSSSSSNSSGSTTTISSGELCTGSTGFTAAASSSTSSKRSSSSKSVGREFSGSNLILEDLSMFYLRQMASSLKVIIVYNVLDIHIAVTYVVNHRRSRLPPR